MQLFHELRKSKAFLTVSILASVVKIDFQINLGNLAECVRRRKPHRSEAFEQT